MTVRKQIRTRVGIDNVAISISGMGPTDATPVVKHESAVRVYGRSVAVCHACTSK